MSPLDAMHDDDDDNLDIYRGHYPADHLPRSSTPLSSLSASSSSPSLLATGRLGAIAAVVELAISRWGRGNASNSSSSSSSHSSVRLSRSQRLRIRGRRSVATLHSVQSERDFAAHISRLKAREESRQIPRRFTLYLPPTSSPRTVAARDSINQRVTWTPSLPLLLPLLDATLKKASRAYRNQSHQGSEHHDHMTLAGQQLLSARPKAWYLDVASPTWEDMRILGKLLHLHPLTLEDILQRDPREKLELFPMLGYYFVSFRAIETLYSNKCEKIEERGTLDSSGLEGGLIGEANIYVIVFKGGVCTFHFTDISVHTERVRSRIMMLEEVFNMSSDWIAHGILDSIVDSFFPLLEEIEREVVAIEDVVLTAGGEAAYPGAPLPKPSFALMRSTCELDIKDSTGLERLPMLGGYAKPRFLPPRMTLSLALRRLRRCLDAKWRVFKTPKDVTRLSPTHITLRRMARTRRLVTSLTRLLATKSEVVAQIKKRLLISNQTSFGDGARREDSLDIAMYMGDVQDHIMTLQHSLAHYERILSQSHPTYLLQLRAGVAFTKSGTDKAIIYLTIVSMAVLCIQPLVGTLSLNVNVPGDKRSLNGSYHVFGIVIALAVCILAVYIHVVRRWWNQAKTLRQQRQIL